MMQEVAMKTFVPVLLLATVAVAISAGTAFAPRGSVTGTATVSVPPVGSGGLAACQQYNGRQRQSTKPGCTHQACSDAKRAAKAALLHGLPAPCHRYALESARPCRTTGCR